MIWVLRMLIVYTVRAVACTWSYRLAGWPALKGVIDEQRPIIGAMFHGRQMCMTGFFSRPDRGPWTVMVSRSRDGNHMAAMLHTIGFLTVRGSSGRGGAQALVEAIAGMRDGSKARMCMAVDGSKGPRYHAKPGALVLATKTGAWLVSVIAVADRHLVLRRTWDHSMIPLPWATISMHCSRPLRIPPGLSAAACERLQPAFQRLMSAQLALVDRHRQPSVRRYV